MSVYILNSLFLSWVILLFSNNESFSTVENDESFSTVENVA